MLKEYATGPGYVAVVVDSPDDVEVYTRMYANGRARERRRHQRTRHSLTD
jgi:hypothetical protein